MVKQANGTFQLEGMGWSNRSHVLQAATNLLPVIQWSSIATNAADTNGGFQFTDILTQIFSRRFYRAMGQ
jgi:hypothetical protein